jgi:hypothetical protein
VTKEREKKREQETHLEHRIPTTRTKRHAVRANTQTTNPVLMTRKYAHPLTLKRIPHVTVEVIVSSEQDATGDGEADGGDAAEDVVVSELVQFAVGAEIEEAAGGVVGTSGEGVAVGEEAV